jgi:hypothetical protein
MQLLPIRMPAVVTYGIGRRVRSARGRARSCSASCRIIVSLSNGLGLAPTLSVCTGMAWTVILQKTEWPRDEDGEMPATDTLSA